MRISFLPYQLPTSFVLVWACALGIGVPTLASPSELDLQWGGFTEGLAGAVQSPKVAVSPGGTVYGIAAYFGQADLDPTPGQAIVSGSSNSYIFALSDSGSLEWLAVYLREGRTLWGVSLYDLAPTQDGGLLVSGSYRGQADLDPGPAIYPVSRTDRDVGFIAKFNASGHFLWAREFVPTNAVSNGQSAITAVSEGADGAVLGAAGFRGQVDMDPDEAEYLLESTIGPESAFDGAVFSLTSDGSLNWVTHIATEGSDQIISVATDGAGGVLAAGGVNGHLSATQPPVYYDGFMTKLTPMNGAIEWTAVLHADPSGMAYVLLRDLALSPDGSVVAVGTMSGRADLDPGVAESIVESEVNSPLVWILDPTGMQGAGWLLDGRGAAAAVTAGALGDLYVTGGFGGTMDFDPGPGTLSRTAGTAGDGFVARYRRDSSLVDVGAWGDTGSDQGVSISAGKRLLVAGESTYVYDIDPGEGIWPGMPVNGLQVTVAALGLDTDQDGIVDSTDNCPFHSNPGQEDSNNNGQGDACEGPEFLLAALRDSIENLGPEVDPGIRTSLLQKLDAAEAALERQEEVDHVVVRVLTALRNQVLALRGTRLTEEGADGILGVLANLLGDGATPLQ